MKRLLSSILIMLLAIMMVSCGRSPDSKFYSLSSVPGATARTRGVGVGVGPIKVAKYLQQPQIVTRKNANRLFLAEFHRWAAPLRDDIDRVLITDLQIMLNSSHVYQYPNKNKLPMKYQVAVTINEFDTMNNGVSNLRAHWQLFSLPNKCLIRSKNVNYKTRVAGKVTYDKIVEAMSRNLTDLSHDIAQQIRRAGGRYRSCA